MFDLKEPFEEHHRHFFEGFYLNEGALLLHKDLVDCDEQLSTLLGQKVESDYHHILRVVILVFHSVDQSVSLKQFVHVLEEVGFALIR